MKKIYLLLFSLILSFNSYSEWVGFVTDANKNIHYIDFEEMTKTDGYVYYWEMTNYANPTDRFLSIATYHKADCDSYRYKDLTFNGYIQEKAQGEPETMDLTVLDNDWTYPVAGSVADYSLKLACQSDANIEESYGDWYQVSSHVDGSSYFYMDPDSIMEKDDLLSFWTLIDYFSPMKDFPLKIQSQVSRIEVNCEENKLRNEVIIDYDENMGKGEMKLLNESPSNDWMTPPPGSNYIFFINIACGYNKLSNEEKEELKIEWMTEMQEDS